jgi:hypothetical protein
MKNEWRTIDTAPRDGSVIITARKNLEGLWVVDTDWFDKYDNRVWLPRTTHWMPLPTPPEDMIK